MVFLIAFRKKILGSSYWRRRFLYNGYPSKISAKLMQRLGFYKPRLLASRDYWQVFGEEGEATADFFIKQSFCLRDFSRPNHRPIFTPQAIENFFHGHVTAFETLIVLPKEREYKGIKPVLTLVPSNALHNFFLILLHSLLQSFAFVRLPSGIIDFFATIKIFMKICIQLFFQGLAGHSRSDLEMGFLGDENGAMLGGNNTPGSSEAEPLPRTPRERKARADRDFHFRSPKSHPAEIVDQVSQSGFGAKF